MSTLSVVKHAINKVTNNTQPVTPVTPTLDIDALIANITQQVLQAITQKQLATIEPVQPVTSVPEEKPVKTKKQEYKFSSLKSEPIVPSLAGFAMYKQQDFGKWTIAELLAYAMANGWDYKSKGFTLREIAQYENDARTQADLSPDDFQDNLKLVNQPVNNVQNLPVQPVTSLASSLKPVDAPKAVNIVSTPKNSLASSTQVDTPKQAKPEVKQPATQEGKAKYTPVQIENDFTIGELRSYPIPDRKMVSGYLINPYRMLISKETGETITLPSGYPVFAPSEKGRSHTVMVAGIYGKKGTVVNLSRNVKKETFANQSKNAMRNIYALRMADKAERTTVHTGLSFATFDFNQILHMQTGDTINVPCEDGRKPYSPLNKWMTQVAKMVNQNHSGGKISTYATKNNDHAFVLDKQANTLTKTV